MVSNQSLVLSHKGTKHEPNENAQDDQRRDKQPPVILCRELIHQRDEVSDFEVCQRVRHGSTR